MLQAFSRLLFILLLGFTFCLPVYSSLAQNKTTPSSQPASNWRVTKAKTFPNWKVEILSQENTNPNLGPASSKALIKDLNGNVKVEIKDVIIEPDPKENIEGWVAGTLLDVDRDGLEDLVLKTNSAGAHCCYTYQIFSLSKLLKKLGDLKLLDCGEKIKLQDLDGTGAWEILTCNAKFTYFKGIPYSQSPFPPQVFALVNGKYTNVDKKYLKVFDEDISAQKKILEGEFNESAAIQLVLDYLLSGRESNAWQAFEQYYTGLNKESRKQEIQDRWNQYLGLKAESRAESIPLNPTSNPAPAGTGGPLP